MSEIRKERLTLIPILAEKHKEKFIGRTALMKYMYFLQTLRDVPLGYNFSLYTYGPFDPDVLSDLDLSVAMKISRSTLEQYPGGYGYKIRAGENANGIKKEKKKFISKYQKDIDWLFEKFGTYSSAELELVSTIVYVDREFSAKKTKDKNDALLESVREIKPHFDKEKIRKFIENLNGNGLLKSKK